VDGLFGVGPLELIVICTVALLVFGPKGLPELGRTIGSWSRKIRDTSREFQMAFQQEMSKAESELEEKRPIDDPKPPQD